MHSKEHYHRNVFMLLRSSSRHAWRTAQHLGGDSVQLANCGMWPVTCILGAHETEEDNGVTAAAVLLIPKEELFTKKE